jgi:hypothetical protein
VAHGTSEKFWPENVKGGDDIALAFYATETFLKIRRN